MRKRKIKQSIKFVSAAIEVLRGKCITLKPILEKKGKFSS